MERSLEHIAEVFHSWTAVGDEAFAKLKTTRPSEAKCFSVKKIKEFPGQDRIYVSFTIANEEILDLCSVTA